MADFGGDKVETMLIEVRASTQGFDQDIAAMRGSVDGTLVDGFSQAGNALEKGLLGAIRKGSLGFGDLRRIAMSVIDDIAAQALGSLFSGQSGTGGGGLLGIGGLVGSILGLPGRATGGNVSPGRGYVVGERGPELFVPTSAGRVHANAEGGAAREVRVAINVTTPQASQTPQALQRSTRQVASAVRRALSGN